MIDPDAERLVDALAVRTQAVRGFSAGFALAAALFVFFVLVPGSERSPLLYVGLGVVFGISFGLLATVALVLVAGYRLTRRL
jgi:hypothetical protein